jgi:hypothetical protein
MLFEFSNLFLKDRTREGVHGSQLKFLEGTWHLSQIGSDVSLFCNIQYSRNPN